MSALTLALAVRVMMLVSAQAATPVELVVDEPAAQREEPWPITTGVPFPRGGLQRMEESQAVLDNDSSLQHS